MADWITVWGDRIPWSPVSIKAGVAGKPILAYRYLDGASEVEVSYQLDCLGQLRMIQGTDIDLLPYVLWRRHYPGHTAWRHLISRNGNKS